MDSICIVTAGNVDAGKSTLLGHFIRETKDFKNILDTGYKGDDHLRNEIAKHPHERELKKTSDIGYKIVTINGKNVTCVDLAGHEKYLKTTARGMTAQYPDYGLLIVGGNNKMQPMTFEHIMLFKQLNIPFAIVFSKDDISTRDLFKEFKEKITRTFKKVREPIFINQLSKIELEKEIDNDEFRKKAIVKIKEELKDINRDSVNKKRLDSTIKQLKKLNINTEDVSLYEAFKTLLDYYEKDQKDNLSTEDIIVQQLKYMSNMKTLRKLTDKEKLFVDRYIRDSSRLLPRWFIDYGIRLSKLSGIDMFRDLTDYSNLIKITHTYIEDLTEKTKNMFSKEKNKSEMCKEFLHFISTFILNRDKPDKDFCENMDELIKHLEMHTVDFDEKKIRSSYRNFIRTDTFPLEDVFKEDEVKMIKDIISDRSRQLEMSNISKIKDIANEFMLNSYTLPIFVVSTKTGYYLESLKTFLAELKTRKDKWSSDDESCFYIDASFGFKSKKKEQVLHYNGFVVSGILRGKDIELGDKVFIGPHEDRFIEAIVKSMHNNFKQNVESLINTERGCLGLQITDEKYKKSFNHKTVKKGMVVVKNKKEEDNICWEIKAEFRINSKSSVTVKTGFRPTMYSDNIKQTVVFIVPDKNVLTPGTTTKDVRIRFTQHSEYIKLNTNEKRRFLISEGSVKGGGVITSILPVRDDPNDMPVKKIRPKRVKPKKKNISDVL